MGFRELERKLEICSALVLDEEMRKSCHEARATWLMIMKSRESRINLFEAARDPDSTISRFTLRYVQVGISKMLLRFGRGALVNQDIDVACLSPLIIVRPRCDNICSRSCTPSASWTSAKVGGIRPRSRPGQSRICAMPITPIP
jgi:hypothetical protein